MARGFYSVVQYCPDRFRAEAVNVGLVLLRVEPHAVRVDISGRYKRIRDLFAVSRPELKNISLAVEGFKCRIESTADEFRTEEDLAAFAASRANDLRLTKPRLAVITDLDQDFERMFAELVDDRGRVVKQKKPRGDVLPTALRDVFDRLRLEDRIWQPGTITVPVFKHELKIPYAYQNGVVNLVKPHVFAATKGGETQAGTLALKGDLIRKHPIDGKQHQLIVVSTRETTREAKEIDEHVEPLFKEYNVRLIRPQQVESFADEIDRTAH